VVTKDVPPYALVVGNPARRVGWVSRAGVRLPEGTDVACPETGERYRIEGDRCMPIDGPEVSEGPIPLLDLEAQNAPIRAAIEIAIQGVVRSNQFIMGPEVAAFEREVARTIGVEHAIGVSSGTDALLVALMALDVGPGDEVITTPFSFFATAGVIHRAGAKPVFVDVEPATFNLDPEQVAAKVTERTKAILPVHLFGQPCDVDAIREAAPGVPIVEDAAQAIGARTDRGPIGGLGELGCFSFFPSKNLGGFGDGGLVTTNDAALAEKVRRLRVHGSHPKYFHAMVGGNFRLDALQAAVLRVKLPHLAGWTAARRANAERYDRLFAEAAAPVMTPPRVMEGHVYNQYTIRCERRDALAEHLGKQKIGHAIYYPLPLHLQGCFAHLGHREGDFPVSEQASREVLSLPIYPEMGEARQRRVVAAVAAFYG
jgi:dTDP-4-amino-4,6-dideoxygalactose transaminase